MKEWGKVSPPVFPTEWVRLLIKSKRLDPRYGNDRSAACKYKPDFMPSDVIMSEVDIIQYSKIVTLILFPVVMNMTTGNRYSRYGFTYHSHLIKVRNVFYR